ncbi:tyrosine-type recombinase/integrase [Bacillus wiedmannii]|uniref:tyrosine-type recombinase/integrase n=1 Tax=Bacillus wiedmannii TaxID=1890302 RepID=UPI001E5CEE39|nr:tyrosine-type recombinase/integrase [Bacillus wiedmannii]MCC2425451.1 site-specific integrase [Bacillus wiedmannii]
MFTEEEKEKTRRALSDKPNWETKSGFTGNRKKNVHKTVGKNKRRTGHLSNKQRKKLTALHNEVDKIFVSISHITKKEEGKLTKKDMRKGKNANQGAHGVHGNKTYEKYKSNCKTFVKWCYQNYNIQSLNDIRAGMYIEFVEDMTKGIKVNGKENETFDYSSKTIGSYISGIEKMTEGAKKNGFDKLEKLGSDNIREKINTFRENYSKKDYKRGKNVNGKLGYSLREAQVIAKKGNELSPYYGAMLEVLVYSGPRLDELRGVKWRQLDLENNRIYLDDPNQNKGGRPRFIPIEEKTSQKLKEIMDTVQPSNKDTRIWGSKITESGLRKLIKHCCAEGKVGYSAVHDFRRSAVEYHLKQLKKEYKKGNLTKEEVAQRILDHVGVDDRLNPMVQKKVENGYLTIKRKNGTTFRKKDWKPVPGEYERKYTMEKLMTHRIDFLMNTLVSEVLGHNRSSATSPYKNG